MIIAVCCVDERSSFKILIKAGGTHNRQCVVIGQSYNLLVYLNNLNTSARSPTVTHMSLPQACGQLLTTYPDPLTSERAILLILAFTNSTTGNTRLYLNIYKEGASYHKTLQDRQSKHRRNNEARSRNHWCRGKAMSITYSECACSLSYPVCTAQALYYTYIVIYGLSGCSIFFHIIS